MAEVEVAGGTPAGARRFVGKVALISGAGSGIGRAVALRMVAEGARVVGVDRDGPALEAVAAEAEAVEHGRDEHGGAEGGATFDVHVADLSEPDACRAAVEACVEVAGRLDVLGNIAGIAASSHVTDVTAEQYRRMMAVNADAPFFLSQAAIPFLLETSGNIVNMASNAGLMGQAYTVAYCMSKGAVIQLTRALAMEYVKTDLRVNAIAPAAVDTPLMHNFEIADGVDFALMQPYMGFRGAAGADELAAAFAFVASDDARSMHGAVLSLDNGITAG